MNLVSPTKPWPQLDGEPLSLHDVVQRGMSEWHERTGGWPTDVVVGDEAWALMREDAENPACAGYFVGTTSERPLYCGLVISSSKNAGIRLARGLPEVEATRERVGVFVLAIAFFENPDNIPAMNAIMDGVKDHVGQTSSDGKAIRFFGIHPDFDEVRWSGDKHDPSIPQYAATIGTGVSGITVTWRRVEQDVNGRN